MPSQKLPSAEFSTPRRPQKTGIPPYMATFADLMSLLLCFFVLLLSMSQIDSVKYKMAVHALRDAFGVPDSSSQLDNAPLSQNTYPAPLQVVRFSPSSTQATTKTDWQHTQAEYLRQLLAEQIIQKQVSIKTSADRVIIRINENASFPSASADLKPFFIPVIDKIAAALTKTDAQFVVSGHTDDRPLNTGIYDSNWQLSAARACSVLHVLLQNPALTTHRFRIEGYADTQPLADNETQAHRALNRRVEIGIIKPLSVYQSSSLNL